VPIQQPEPPAWLKELAEAHLPGMQPHVKRTLLGVVRGLGRSTLAMRESVTEATIKRWIDGATEQILSRLTAPRTSHGELRGAWVALHWSCCGLGDGAAA
jgi:hypothetical protein